MTLSIISANLNGIRSAHDKGFFEWMLAEQADFICVQELKAQAANLSDAMLNPGDYHGYFHYAEKKGYSGVGVYSKHKPNAVHVGLGIELIDREGRYLQLDFDQLSIISTYFPSGSSGEERQAYKFYFLDAIRPRLKALLDSGKEVVVCGDLNIAHQAIDLKNPKSNQKNSGFLPEERAWMTHLQSELGWYDTWRQLYPEAPGYTWWSQRGAAYAKDVGWRIDYQLTTPNLGAQSIEAKVYKDIKFSDHAPLITHYDWPTP